MRQWIVSDNCLSPYSVPGHYLNKCWVVVNWTLRNKLRWNFNHNTKRFIHEIASENIVWEMGAILSRARWDNLKLFYIYIYIYVCKACDTRMLLTMTDALYHVFVQQIFSVSKQLIFAVHFTTRTLISSGQHVVTRCDRRCCGLRLCVYSAPFRMVNILL